MQTTALLQPVIILGLWTTLMCIWMYATRIPAMTRMGLDAQAAERTSDLGLPPNVTRIADNYNHLFEQPTLFYVISLAIVLAGHVDALHVQAAWAFVGLRIIHSLVHTVVNIVMLRFSIFILSWIALAVMLVREAMMLF